MIVRGDLLSFLAEHSGSQLRVEFERVIVGPAPVALRLHGKLHEGRWHRFPTLIFPPDGSTAPYADLARLLAGLLESLPACRAPGCSLADGHRTLHDIRERG